MEQVAEQPPVDIRPQTWERWAPENPVGYELWMSALEVAANSLTRSDVVAAVSERILLVVPLAAMWGAGLKARAIPKNVGIALEDPVSVEGALERMVAGIVDSPTAAFEAIWQPDDYSRPAIRGFGTSFGTKLLSFLDQAVAQRADNVDASLIYDLMVCRALAAAGARWPEEMRGSGPPTFDPPDGCVRFASYGSYCTLAGLVARRAGCTPQDVEYTLFRLGQELGPDVELPRSGCGASDGGEATVEDEDDPAEYHETDGSLVTSVREIRELLTPQ